MESIAFAIFSLLVVYVCYWAIKNDDGGIREPKDKRFDVSGRGSADKGEVD